LQVIVVGAGMVGSALACALAQKGFKTAVAEVRAPETQWPEGSYDVRVSAITRCSQAIFQNLGVWDAMQAQRVTAYRDMRVWDTADFGEIRFSAADVGEPDLGHIVENRVVTGALWQALHALDNAEVFCPAFVQALESLDAQQRVWLTDGSHLDADLVVAADGANSKIRGLAEIADHGWAYGQTAVVCTVRPEYGHSETAWQHFLPTGPLALLPLGADRFSIVWSTTPEHADSLLAMTDGQFGRALTQASDGRVGKIELAGSRHAFALQLQRADAYIKPGIALVGDAAHVIHPLAGQGVNLGLLDAAALVDVLIEARKLGRALGSTSTLRRYERMRKGDNLAMQYAMDGFKRLFSNDLVAAKLLRNLGLLAADRIVPLKREFTRIAMGSMAETPSLARRMR
jgi:2-octaprenylphenol hydroxylase